MFADAGHVQPSLLFLIHPLGFCVHQPIHGIFAAASAARVTILFFTSIAAHTGPASCASSLAFVMPRQSITTSEPPPALGADVRSLTRVELGVPLQVVQAPEPGATGLTDVRLFLAVGEKMAFQIVMPRELGGTEWTAVFFRGW